MKSPFALLPYHNPHKTSIPIPRGWRLRYQHEAGTRATGPCRIFINDDFPRWSPLRDWGGMSHLETYIVPIDC